MAVTLLNRIQTNGLIRIRSGFHYSKVKSSTFESSTSARKFLLTTSGLIGIGSVSIVYALNESVKASDLELHPPSYPWDHMPWLHSFDHRSLRRGYEVYKQVCAACHSMKYVCYRELVGVTHTEEEARVEAAEILVEDGPDEKGKMFMRPGKLSDHFPAPYKNDEEARAANNGALPPDLSYVTGARHGHEDYIFSLLTGYCEPPAGIKLGEGQHFNPYFPGGAIGMAQALFSEMIEYQDGTPASQSQLAKDVATFLSWTWQPEHDERKKMAINIVLICGALTLGMWYWKRHVWTSLKSRKILFRSQSKS